MKIPLRGLQQRFGREGVYTQQTHARNQGWSTAHSLFSVNIENHQIWYDGSRQQAAYV